MEVNFAVFGVEMRFKSRYLDEAINYALAIKDKQVKLKFDGEQEIYRLVVSYPSSRLYDMNDCYDIIENKDLLSRIRALNPCYLVLTVLFPKQDITVKEASKMILPFCDEAYIHVDLNSESYRIKLYDWSFRSNNKKRALEEALKT